VGLRVWHRVEGECKRVGACYVVAVEDRHEREGSCGIPCCCYYSVKDASLGWLRRFLHDCLDCRCIVDFAAMSML
jgi:hypothetical protein